MNGKARRNLDTQQSLWLARKPGLQAGYRLCGNLDCCLVSFGFFWFLLTQISSCSSWLSWNSLLLTGLACNLQRHSHPGLLAAGITGIHRYTNPAERRTPDRTLHPKPGTRISDFQAASEGVLCKAAEFGFTPFQSQLADPSLGT